jgi:PAS domain S-box-containing protein
VGADEQKDMQLRLTALQNAESDLIARQRVERALVEANEALARATAALRASEERFRATFNQAAVGIAIAGLDRRFIEANEKFASILGYAAHELRGLTFTELTHPQDLAETQRELQKLLAGEIPRYSLEKRYVRKDGAVVWSATTVTLVRDSQGNPLELVGIIEDITGRKVMDESLRDSDRRKDEFLATLAHELRNPLAPIRQAAQISKSAGATDAQKRWSHDVISRQVHHMSLLLDDLLDVSRITRGTLELRMGTTELAAVIDAAVETARPAIDAKRHHFSLDIPKEPIHFAADPLRLAQVLSNLLTNAAKYTDPDGSIWLSAQCGSDTIDISVRDTGIGIPVEASTRIFEMFSQVKSGKDRSEGGLGIGLALARGLTELHGGTIEARSAGSGHGSEFIVRLPRRTAGVLRREDAVEASPPSVVRRRVLIADDNQDAAESLAMLLRMEGHEVCVAHDGRAALDAFSTFQPEVALLDIGMPGISGYTVAREVRKSSLGRAVALVAVTGWGQDSDKAQALAAGFNHHFTKPVEPERLIDLLRSDRLLS